jgi:hypothetical protein
MRTHTETAFETLMFDGLVVGGYEVVPGDGFDGERAIYPQS